MDEKATMLKRLSEAHGVSGYEGEIREVIKEYIEPYATTIQRDKLGSIIAERVGVSDGPRIMLTGHMDEIGFMVKSITPEAVGL
jgi:putative aminopeptidase FrvX